MAVGDKRDKNGKLIASTAPTTGTTPLVGSAPLPSPDLIPKTAATPLTTPTGGVIPSFFTPAAENSPLGVQQRELADAVKGYAKSGEIGNEGARLMQEARKLGVPENSIRGLYDQFKKTAPTLAPTAQLEQAQPEQAQQSTRLLDRYDTQQGKSAEVGVSPMGSVSSRQATGSRGTPIGNGASQKNRFSAIASGIMSRAAEERDLNDELRRARIEAYKKAGTVGELEKADLK